jgi:hypothetical protein
VWGKGTTRKIVTPTLTAGIRGTGVYTEVLPDQNRRTYFLQLLWHSGPDFGRRQGA